MGMEEGELSIFSKELDPARLNTRAEVEEVRNEDD